MNRFFALLGVIALFVSCTAQAQTASSLSKVPGLIKTPEGKAVWNEQMLGKAEPDGLGTQLPAGLTREQLLTMLVPEDQRAQIGLVGAKPWLRRANSYVAIACALPGVSRGVPPTDCKDVARDGVVTAYVGVIEMAPGAPAKLVAASGAVTRKTPWASTDLPSSPVAAENAKDGLLAPQSWKRFDLANYRLKNDVTAFGLRAGWMQSYSGGGAFFEALYLFVIDGDRLRVVLAEPMTSFEDIAGDWHKNGTRDHDISEGSRTLVIARQATDGYFDLQLKSTSSKTATTLRWSAAEQTYR